MAGLCADTIDLTVTSPPYDNLRKYAGLSFLDFQSIAQHLFRITKDGGIVVWVVADATIEGSETGTSFRQALYFLEIGFRLHDTMIYFTEKPPLTHNRYEQKFEYMFIFSKGKPKTFNGIREPSIYAGKIKGMTFRHDGETLEKAHTHGPVKATKLKGNVWKYNTGKHHSTKYDLAFNHPAIMPEQLAEDHIVSWSNIGDTVLDPFMGSGTTCSAAKKLDRKFIGIEMDEGYFKIAEARLA